MFGRLGVVVSRASGGDIYGQMKLCESAISHWPKYPRRRHPRLVQSATLAENLPGSAAERGLDGPRGGICFRLEVAFAHKQSRVFGGAAQGAGFVDGFLVFGFGVAVVDDAASGLDV
ncbi:MAG: hypothetical protein JWS10_283 [Cypionkella sp.]|nr:hypothetical protein [Cypionkella sp.]